MVALETSAAPEIQQSGIHGVWTLDLKEIDTEGGPVLHMLRADSPLYQGFGEVYFSVVLPGAVKAWKRHRLQTQRFAVPSGILEVVIYDERDDSPTKGTVAAFCLGRPGNYRLLCIPPGVWYGFTAKSDEPVILANCTDIPHAQGESDRIPKDSPLIPYTWEA